MICFLVWTSVHEVQRTCPETQFAVLDLYKLVEKKFVDAFGVARKKTIICCEEYG